MRMIEKRRPLAKRGFPDLLDGCQTADRRLAQGPWRALIRSGRLSSSTVWPDTPAWVPPGMPIGWCLDRF